MKLHDLFTRLILFTLAAFLSTGCASTSSRASTTQAIPQNPIVILYDNDVHCAVDGYAHLVSVREMMENDNAYVTTVSAGDFISGDIVGTITKGEAIIDIMNRVQYDVIALGNHEFDFGLPHILSLTEALDATTVCANLRHIESNKPLFTPYKIISYDDVDIAYIGITTSATSTLVSANTFRNERDELIYDFSNNNLYAVTQHYIDQAINEGADYVVALAHLGDVGQSGHSNSVELINNTHGIDVLIDGHDHHTIEGRIVKNNQGEDVILTSSGTKFQYIGAVTLSTEGKFSTQLIAVSSEDSTDAATQDYVNQIKQEALEAGKRVIGHTSFPISMLGPDGKRIVRNSEATLGNLCADAIRYGTNAEIAMINGGGIRASINEGDITINDCFQVFSFNNTVCTATMSGAQILDALEFGARATPTEVGGFLHVSGLRYQIDLVPSPVVLDDKGMCSHITDGKRRVNNVEVFDSQSNSYKPIELDRIYTVGSFEYLITGKGDAGVLQYATLKDGQLGQDLQMLSEYIEKALGGVISEQYRKPEGRILINLVFD
ncbi:MAG: bifunctional UDP-sugar hydrolase/5'-nucleotidase [Alistipes sp.]|nr:bifunctional UDP-sugar hydrolase/5'-nucleotidase [Alistipes sp.]